MSDLCDGCGQPDSCAERGCFAERVGSISFGAVPGGTRRADRVLTNVKPPEEPSWEKGIAGEHRPGGGFMPYLNERGSAMGVHEYSHRRKEVEAIRDRHRNDPNVFR